MPKGYEEIRDKFKKEGMKLKDAKKKAARIWTNMYLNNPVTRKKEKK